jgi:Rad3-related DNA helicase
MSKRISISVRYLVEFILRSGSIDNRFGSFDRAYEGSRIHRLLQKAAGANYQAEVTLSLDNDFGDYILTVEGRADGIITDDEGVMLDEIKTTAVPFEIIDEDFNSLHWAQAECYAYMYCKKYGIDDIRIRLTYYQVDTGELRQFIKAYSKAGLESLYSVLLSAYKIWADLQYKWGETRNLSIKSLDFPFGAYRRGQRKLAASVYKTVVNGGKLFCQAPTGIGKTISTLFPSVKALGEGRAERIFYLTAKTITRQAAESACTLMRDKGLRIKSLTLTAKDKICFMGSEKHECNPDNCRWAEGFYDRVNEALYELLEREDCFTRELIEEQAKKHRLCPYELSLELALFCDCIIADYNYLFDPRVYLRRFFYNKTGDYVFLIDEAHNLLDRAREMYSAELNKKPFLTLSRQLDKKEKLRKTLADINKEMIEMKKDCGEALHLTKQSLNENLIKLLYDFISGYEEWSKRNPHNPLSQELLELFFEVLSFVKTAENYDSHYTTLLDRSGGDLSVKLFCIDPSFLLSERMKAGRAAILFSATLTPLDYFSSVLGGDDNSDKLMLPSPFLRENLCLLIADRISTKYKDRTDSLNEIVSIIKNTAGCRQGNYMVYFPSYSYMRAAHSLFAAQFPDTHAIIQQESMKEEEREAFLKEFDGNNSETLIGFCVMGGIFSEGIDLKGDRLIGTVIVGVGLPQINITQDIIRAYYDRLGDNGFCFAYQYPGFNKVLQAAGRVIRDENDRGVLVLVDERFTSPNYLSLLPEHFYGFERIKNSNELRSHIEPFWTYI